jgi:hypothetical protein
MTAAAASAILQGFARRTGVTGDQPPRRYLWTDAFAVCTWLGLGERELALRLIDQVHHVLGRHRPDDRRRTGWLGGQGEAEGEAHPTRGGLRIGKPLPERGPTDPYVEDLEWERDGQYFHYLTRWMHALDQTSRATGQPLFRTWARELAIAAHRGFVRPGRVIWKASIDLSRPQVDSMGQHDPLDGYLTCLQLGLAAPAADFAALIPRQLATTDPLGIGGLLVDAGKLDQLAHQGAPIADGLLAALIEAAAAGLRHHAGTRELRGPAARRLAFRELGLAIGLAAAERLVAAGVAPPLARFLPLRGEIESFWAGPEHQLAPAWREHLDINEVMLAASLAPAGYVDLPPLKGDLS